MKVPFFRPSITDDDVRRVVDVLRSGWLTSGPLCEDVEDQLRQITGAKHALVMASCTAALHTAVAYHNPEPYERVIVPDFTFAATATSVINAGAWPLLCDIEPQSGGLDPVQVERLLRTKASVIGIIAVHYAGIPCDVSRLRELARSFNVFLIEDAAHALGAVHEEGPVGSGSRDGAALSFYATKNVTSGEGGALLTDNDDLACFARAFRYHGLTRIAWERLGSPCPFDADYDIQSVGFKYNLSDMSAGLLLGQLRRFEEGQRQRKRIAETYVQELSSLPVDCMGAGIEGHAWHLFVIRSDKARDLSQHLSSLNIGTQRHYRPLHDLTFLHTNADQFPCSSRLSETVLSLPLYPDLSSAEQEYVIDSVRNFFNG